jgi:azurin
MATITQAPSDNLWTEPESAASVDTPPVYPYNNIQSSESGHSFEMDDTPGRERVRIQHGPQSNGTPGTFIEMHPNGDEVHKVYGTGYEIHMKGKNVLIKGTCNITIEGNANMQVLGDYNVQVSKDYNLQVGGKMNTRVVGDLSLSSDGDMSITANENFGGAIRMAAADHLYLDSDLVVAGSINADLITAESRVNAGTGLYAGLQGVHSLGPITSLVSVTAPLGTFGIMDAVLMTDVINSNIYKTHTHIGNHGYPTSPPNAPFFGV